MTPNDFVYWLQGYAEIGDSATLTPHQWSVVKDHLGLVLHKVTPNRVPCAGKTTIPVTSGNHVYDPTPIGWRLAVPSDFAANISLC